MVLVIIVFVETNTNFCAPLRRTLKFMRIKNITHYRPRSEASEGYLFKGICLSNSGICLSNSGGGRSGPGTWSQHPPPSWDLVTTPLPPQDLVTTPPPLPRTWSQYPLGPGHNTPSPPPPGPGHNTPLPLGPGHNTPCAPHAMRRWAVRILLECILVVQLNFRPVRRREWILGSPEKLVMRSIIRKCFKIFTFNAMASIEMFVHNSILPTCLQFTCSKGFLSVVLASHRFQCYSKLYISLY